MPRGAWPVKGPDMFRPLFSACGGAVALALVLTGLVVPATPSVAAEPTPSTPSSSSSKAWTPSPAADDEVYEGANVPEMPVPERGSRSFQATGSQARIAPSGTAVGAPGLGALPYFGFQDFNLSANMVARVNLANGNLLLTANDATLSGPGLSLRSDRFYNGLSTSVGAFGGGWSSSLFEKDVRLDVMTTSAVYTGANGFQATFTKNGSTWAAPAGFNASLVQHAPQGDPYRGLQSVYTLTFNQTGERTEFSDNGWIVGQFDRNGVGNKWNYPDAYEDTGRQVSVSNAAGRGFNIIRDESGNISTIQDSAQRATTYTKTQDSTNSLGRVDGLAGYSEQYVYDAKGRISQITFSSATSGVTPRAHFDYDANNRVVGLGLEQVESSTANWAYTEFSYASGQTDVIDYTGARSLFKIDTSGRISSVTDQLQRARSQSWTPNSDISSSTDALGSGSTPGNSTTYAYDQLGNQTTVALPTGAGAAALYATGSSCTGSGGTAYQVKCSTSDSGSKTTNNYDAVGNLLTQTDSTSGGTGAISQTNTYQGTNSVTCGGVTGQICSTTDGNNRATSYTYDAKGNVLKVTPPSPLGETVYTYDALGRTVTVTDGNQKKTTYAYDQRDQLVKTTWSDGSTLTSTYVSGLKTKDVDSIGGSRNFRYDFRGLITYEDAPGAGVSTYTYDQVGNMTSAVTPNGTVRYAYDDANQLLSIVEASGSCAASTPASGSGCIKFEYDTNGAESKRIFPGGASVTQTRDKAGRVTRITARNAATSVVSDIGYSYSADGSNTPASDRTNIQRRTSFMESGITAGAVTSYSYDSLSRLTAAIEKTGMTTSASWAYGYDKAGNRTSQARSGATGAAAGNISYTYNAANQLTGSTGASTTYTYDATGNQTRNGATGQTSSYNSRQAVTQIGSTTFSSFGQGNAFTVNRGAPAATYGTNSQGLTTEATSSGTTGFTRKASGDIVSARLPNAQASYFVLDHLGSVVGIFDKTGTYKGGYSYSPYGEARSVTNEATVNANPIRYIGGYYDAAVNLYKLGARFYDPSQGRFTQFDPSGQEANPYGYAGCNPISGKDPSGLLTVCVLVTFEAALYAAVAGVTRLASAIAAFIPVPAAALTGRVLALAPAVYTVSALVTAFRARIACTNFPNVQIPGTRRFNLPNIF